MSRAAEYRGFADKLREEAKNAPLHKRQSGLKAAKNWELIAKEAEQTERLLQETRPTYKR